MASRTGNQDTAKRYATAFFELAKEQSQLDVIGRDMQTLGALLDAHLDAEERLIFPVASQVLTADTKARLSEAMRARRQSG